MTKAELLKEFDKLEKEKGVRGPMSRFSTS